MSAFTQEVFGFFFWFGLLENLQTRRALAAVRARPDAEVGAARSRRSATEPR